jgi:diguanylate cyclase (GGDEF)-like protein
LLVAVAEVLRACCREDDRPGRLGGEEFALLLARAPLATALVVAERIRASIQALQLTLSDGQILRVTASIGVAQLGDDLEGALQAADTALYAAKKSGRNQIVLADDSADTA